MAIKKEIPFSLLIRGDGSSKSFTASVLTDPFLFQTSGNALPEGFPVGTALPSAIADPTCSGFTVTATILAGIVTFTFETAPENDTDYFVTGKLQF
jgi:hypothetical protein